MYKRLFFMVSIMFALAMPAAVAQDTTTIMTADDPEYGTYFTDAEGMALYIFLKDVPNSGASSCYDKCEDNWPVFSAEEPLTLPEGVPGELGTITRTDDSTQVTYNGWPLYYWVNDKAPGDVTGQNVGDVWFLAIPTEGDAIPGAEAPQASPMASPAAQGTILTEEDATLGTIFTDAKGMTLYIFLKDVPNSGESTCYDKCEENWPVFSAEEPLTLPEGVPGELGTIKRTDGSMQVTYNGWPLYYWVKDAAPGDVTGQGVGDVWYVAVPTEGDAVPGADVPQASPAASTGSEGNEVKVSLSEMVIDMPTELTAGMTVFTVTNDGTIDHNFEIEGQGIEMELEQNLKPGETGTLTVDLKAGTYEIYCPVGQHADHGMKLDVTVKD